MKEGCQGRRRNSLWKTGSLPTIPSAAIPPEAVMPSALTAFFHRKFAAYFYSGLSNFGYICSNALSQVHAIVLGTASVSLSNTNLSI